ncbi:MULTISPECIES: substrate-binding domain-containing protein [unclassified Acidovorax]|uniref:substrate-binding domain-containing protein n=1 Tax=unclassified Acidovorax TaxID=2684926 RepID=UPI002882E1F3|nr:MULTISPECIES: substrate-binding domain-containing protein [unclassified Acidovorax]
MAPPLVRGISSMATRTLLAELLADWQRQSGMQAAIESVGGVDAARRVREGESFDVVVLASDAIAKLEAAGRIVPGSTVDVARSGVAVAVRAGAAHPPIGTEAQLREAVLAAPTIGYSTGPSGVALQQLFERWGIADLVQSRTVQAPAGTPVGTLVARGDVALGFQQFSELMHLQGIDVIGPLPDAVQITTVFSAAVVAGAAEEGAARELLAFLASPAAAAAKQRQGMEPA